MTESIDDAETLDAGPQGFEGKPDARSSGKHAKTGDALSKGESGTASAGASQARRKKRHMPAKLALLSVTLLTIVLRYPGDHERGVDSFSFHALAAVVVQTGSMGWLVNAFSYFGLSPFSYPPAVPVSIAAFVELSGLSVEAAILVYALLLGAVAGWTSFLLGRAVFHKDSPALILSFLFSISGGVVAFTNWNLSSRGSLLVFVPLVLALTIRAVRSVPPKSWKMWLAVALVSVVLVLIHFMWLLLVPLLIATLALYRIAAVENSILIHTRGAPTRSRVILATHAIIAFVFAAGLLWSVAGLFTFSHFPTIRSSVLPDNIITRVGVEYATEMGLAIVVLPIGIWQVLMFAERTRRFAATALIVAFLPVSIDPVYGILLAIPVTLLVASAALSGKFPLRAPRIFRRPFMRGAFVVVALAAFLVVPYAVTVPRAATIGCGQGGSLDNSAYDAGMYLRYVSLDTNFSFAYDDPLNAARLEAVSGIPSVEPILSIGVLAYPWLAQRNHIEFTRSDDVFQGLINEQQILRVREWISAAGAGYPYYFGKHSFVLSLNTPDSAVGSAILDAYGTRYAVQICQTNPSTFFRAVSATSYVVFDNRAQRVYWIAR